jgi:serine/threonine protein phosphatase PrpC
VVSFPFFFTSSQMRSNIRSPTFARSGRISTRFSTLSSGPNLFIRPTTTTRVRIPERTFYNFDSSLFPFGHSESIGPRPTMEDACVSCGNFAGPGTQYFALFDGHGGREAAHYCAEQLHLLIAQRYVPGDSLTPVIKDAIREINRQVISRWIFAGTTAAIVVIADNQIYTANVGDSRVILIDGGHAKRLTFDHKATVPSERRAIMARGGRVLQGRVSGILMLSRAIGDAEVANFISCEPYMTVTPFKDDYKMIIACDGVWDVMMDQQVADIFNRSRTPSEAAQAIKVEALRRRTTDNVSVMCIDFKVKLQRQTE